MNKKNKTTFDPFKDLVLDKYEQEIEDYLNTHDVPLVKPSAKELTRLQKAAENTLKLLKKDEHINVRVPHSTKLALKQKAAKLGLRYQTLIGSILHQYATS